MSVFNIISIICLSLCFLMFFYFKWYIKKCTSDSELEKYRSELKKLESDIDAVTDRNLQLIEDSIPKLKILLEETDQRISVYNNELGRSRASETLYTSLGRGIRAALKTIEEPAQEEPAPLPPEPPAAVIPAVTVQAPPPEVKIPSKQQIRAAIDFLINEGLTAQDIAARLQISIAEVDLAMNLFKRK